MCHARSGTSLVCTAPSFSGGDPLDTTSINYTVVMDNAPGPSNTGLLGLSLVPDPSIPTDGSALLNAVFTTGNVIQIRVNCSLVSRPSHPAFVACSTASDKSWVWEPGNEAR